MKQGYRKKLKNNGGITLIALAVTILVLIILASISIKALTGDNGIIGQSKNAKEQAEIDSEKEVIETSVVQATGKDRYGNITKENMKEYMDKNAGEGKTEVIDNGDTLVVKFIDSERYYEVDIDGNTEGPKELINDKNVGDLSKGEKNDGSEEKPFEINCIEDLVTFSIMSNGGNSELGISSSNFSGKYVVLNRTLDFNSIFSYNDYTTTKYGDLNTDGVIEDIRTELTKKDEGCIGFKAINSFDGTFDGKENMLKNIYQYKGNSNDGTTFLGVFVRGKVTIKNLTITGDIINKIGIAAVVYSADSCAIINCENYANITGIDFTCGICYNDYGTAYINGCINYGKIVNENMSGSYYGASGIGYGNGMKIVNCINEGEIITNGKWGWYNLSGGITCTTNNNTIQNCINKGKCDAGIVGWLRKGESYIENCYDVGKCSYAITGPGVGGEGPATLINLYYQTDISTIASRWESYITGLTETEIKNNETFVETLNNNIGENTEWKRWKIGEDGYPTFE